MVVLVVLMAGFTFWLFRAGNGEIVFTSDEEFLSYEIVGLSDSGVESWSCGEIECRLKLKAGRWDIFISKEGYYNQEESLLLEKGAVIEIEVELKVEPGVRTASRVDIDLEMPDYGESSDFSWQEDEETGYMGLWEGQTRRATFMSGFIDGKVFAGENSALAWDSLSGEAYLIDFREDSREFLFEIENLEEVMFAGEKLFLKAGGLVYFWDEELAVLPGATDLKKVTYFDGGIYFLTSEGFRSLERVLIEGLEIAEESALVSDGEGVYVLGEEVYEVRW